MTTPPLGDAFAHHIWASERLIDSCTALTPDQLRTPVPGTYGSIIDTLRHLVGSDAWYLGFFVNGDRVTRIDEDWDGALDELRSVTMSNGRVWMELLGGEIDPDADVVDQGDGWEFHSPVGIRLAQVIHHGTDHRSQVCTALTSLGQAPPEIDVWAFGESAGRTRDVKTAAMSPRG